MDPTRKLSSSSLSPLPLSSPSSHACPAAHPASTVAACPSPAPRRREREPGDGGWPVPTERACPAGCAVRTGRPGRTTRHACQGERAKQAWAGSREQRGDEIGGSPSLPCPIPSHACMGIGRVANKNTVRALKIGPGQQTNSQKADRVVRPGHKTTLLSLRGSLPRARANSPLICASGARRRPRSAGANGCQPDRFTPGPPARCTKAAWGSAKRARGPAGQPAPAGGAADGSSEAGPRRHEHPAAVLLER